MSTEVIGVDLGSLRALREAFRAAAEPVPADLVGDHEAQFVGPLWLRASSPAAMRLGRMAGWCGKRFEGAPDATTPELHGVNRVRRAGRVHDSIPITARVAPSRLDGRAALGVAYPPNAPFPWPRVLDELRPLAPGVLLGMTFGLPLSPAAGLPFLLRRVPDRGR